MTTKAHSNRYTHTATLVHGNHIGPRQLGNVLPAGTTVEVLRDPTVQQGDLITIRRGTYTGVARISNLTDVQAK